MIKDKSIFIKNIYYMLSYAFQVLKHRNYEEIDSERFENAQDLFAAILVKAVAQQLKQGLYREYVGKHEKLNVLRGKLDINGTIRAKLSREQKLACEYDELSENNLFNQIMKTTMLVLVRDDGVKRERKVQLKKLLVFFDGIETLEPSQIQWNRLNYRRNNRSYELLMNICWFVLAGMLQTTEKGQYKMLALSDEHMAKLYERFILEYYRKHHTYLSEVKAAQVEWDLEEGTPELMIRFLPNMQTDVFLRNGEKILIIDAKYYGSTLTGRFDKQSLHSANIYQIFTYVKNQDKLNTGNVSGLLLYAKTDEPVTPTNLTYNIGGNRIDVKTLDLNTDFKSIAKQLDEIVEEML